jgi:hypothetical protein
MSDNRRRRLRLVTKDGRHFEPGRCRVGARVKDRVEILRPACAEGETMRDHRSLPVDSESRLRAAIEGADNPRAE